MNRPNPASAAIDALLAERGDGKTICPSEAARRLAGEGGDWRAHMDQVHAATRDMAAAGKIRLTWRGEPMDEPEGPYRIARP